MSCVLISFTVVFNCIIDYRLIYQSNEPSPVIVLEDASVHGYNVIDKPPEDFDVSLKIVKRLAKFHAASFYLISDHVSCTNFC